MTEQNNLTSTQEQQLDQLLNAAFQQPRALPKDFENEVMQRLDTQPRSWLQAHRVFLVMAVYWAAAAALCAGLLSGSSWADDVEILKVLLPTAALSLLPVWLMARKFQVSLGGLFLKTLQ